MQKASLVTHTTSKTFEGDVLKSDLPVFVDFYADWCGPCHYVTPIIAQLAQEYQGKVKFVKVDTDSNPDIAYRYGIQGIPTLIIFKNGQPVERIVGAASKEYYVHQLSHVLGTADHTH